MTAALVPAYGAAIAALSDRRCGHGAPCFHIDDHQLRIAIRAAITTYLAAIDRGYEPEATEVEGTSEGAEEVLASIGKISLVD